VRNWIKRCASSRFLQHLLFWALFLVLLTATPEAQAIPLWKLALHNLVHIGVLIPPVYLHFFILEKFFFNRRYATYIALLWIIAIPSTLAANVIFKELIDYKGGIPGTAYFIFFSLLIATAAKLVKKAVRQQLQIRDIESKQLETELALLKEQINPHFLFNTLNNLYGMARNQDRSTAEGIAHLSHLMRYMIHESRADRVDLEKEIEQINRLIKLQELRFAADDKIDIDFRVEGDPKAVQIPPMLLIPFVENSFKHGISLDRPSFIKIALSAQRGHLEFSIKNSVHGQRSKPAEPDTGQGLRNVKRRLELLFPRSHELKIEVSANDFNVDLAISL
jgi:two-component system LytT family sensor kinase